MTTLSRLSKTVNIFVFDVGYLQFLGLPGVTLFDRLMYVADILKRYGCLTAFIFDNEERSGQRVGGNWKPAKYVSEQRHRVSWLRKNKTETFATDEDREEAWQAAFNKYWSDVAVQLRVQELRELVAKLNATGYACAFVAESGTEGERACRILAYFLVSAGVPAGTIAMVTHDFDALVSVLMPPGPEILMVRGPSSATWFTTCSARSSSSLMTTR